VQHVGGGDTARELAVDVDVVLVEHVRDPHLRRHHVRALVHAAFDRGVRVGVDDAGDHVAPGRVDHARAGGDGDVRPHRGDAAVADEHGAVS
jgi:hypothetical protein